MNIAPISACKNVLNIASCKRSAVFDNQPLPETSDDKVSFKGSYEKVLKEVMSAKLTKNYNTDVIMEKLFNVILKDSKANGIKRTDEFFEINRLANDNYGIRYFFEPLMRKLGGFDEISGDGEKFMINKLQKKLAKGDITLATVDNMPIFELRKRDLKDTKGYKTAFAPSNIYEFKFTSPRGGSEIIMGINKNGEISVERNSNMAMSQYTLFHNSPLTYGVKVLKKGNLGDEHFVGKYFNRFGWYDPILSIFIR